MIKEVNDITYLNCLSDYKVTLNPFNKIIGYYINDLLVAFLDYSVMYEKIEINYIFVVNEYRRKNIAYNLIKYIIDNYKFDNITLEVNINNINAINLYKKLGFKIISIRKNYYDGIDGYLMEVKYDYFSNWIILWWNKYECN